MVMEHCRDFDVGTPSYAPAWRPAQPDVGIAGDRGAGPPAIHKFDRTDFVPRFLAEAAEAAQGGLQPLSLLSMPGPQQPDGPADVDSLDLWDPPVRLRYRKLYQPMHFRFYLAACELRCLVPGLPAPQRSKIKKVEMVIRRVAMIKGKPVDAEEWAWIDIPSPSAFPSPVPDEIRKMTPRLTGNNRVWWPIPGDQPDMEGEQRFPMSRAHAAGLEARALYFAFVPLASGEMYGPLRTLTGPDPLDPSQVVPKRLPALGLNDPYAQPARPLVPAPSNFPLRPATIAKFKDLSGGWLAVLGRLIGNTPIDGPRPKFEPPPLTDPKDNPPPGAWGYVIRCVATLELSPGCQVECWGPPTAPAVIAPQFDPFAGRPTRIDVPSMAELAKLVPTGTDVHLAGGLGFGISSGLQVTSDGKTVTGVNSGDDFNLCFFGIPLITICAYVMLSLALAIVLPFLSFLLLLKFCLPTAGRRP